MTKVVCQGPDGNEEAFIPHAGGISTARNQGRNKYLFSDTFTQTGKIKNTSFLREGNRTAVHDFN